MTTKENAYKNGLHPKVESIEEQYNNVRLKLWKKFSGRFAGDLAALEERRSLETGRPVKYVGLHFDSGISATFNIMIQLREQTKDGIENVSLNLTDFTAGEHENSRADALINLIEPEELKIIVANLVRSAHQYYRNRLDERHRRGDKHRGVKLPPINDEENLKRLEALELSLLQKEITLIPVSSSPHAVFRVMPENKNEN